MPLLTELVALLGVATKDRTQLVLESIALRHQLAVYKRSALGHEAASCGAAWRTQGAGSGSMGHSEPMKSRAHPKYKTRHRVTNWRKYQQGMVQRGDVTVWLSPEALDAWKAQPNGRRGAQPKFSDLAIVTALTLRLVFHLPLRGVGA